MDTSPPLVPLAMGLLWLLALFLVVFGVTACIRPSAAGAFLAGFAGTACRHYAELAVRMAFGWALIHASADLTAASWIAGAGWVLLVTSGLMLLVPWKLHRSFARRAVPKAPAALRAMGVPALCGGALLLWTLCARIP